MTLKARAHSLSAVKAEPVYTISVQQDVDDVDIVLLKDGAYCARIGYFDSNRGLFNCCYYDPAGEKAKDLDQAGIALVKDVDGDYTVAIHSLAYQRVRED